MFHTKLEFLNQFDWFLNQKVELNLIMCTHSLFNMSQIYVLLVCQIFQWWNHACLSLHLNSVFAECFKPGYCNILVIISKVSLFQYTH